MSIHPGVAGGPVPALISFSFKVYTLSPRWLYNIWGHSGSVIY